MVMTLVSHLGSTVTEYLVSSQTLFANAIIIICMKMYVYIVYNVNIYIYYSTISCNVVLYYMIF